MGKIKVLHLIKSLGRGGAEMLLPETLNVHDKTVFEFHYIYFLPWKNQVVFDIEQAGGKVTCIAATNNLKIVFSAKKIASYIRSNEIDIVHCHLPWAGIVGRIAGKLTKTPIIYTEHNKWERYHRVTYYLNKTTFSWQSSVIPCSHEVAASIQKYYKKAHPRIVTIPNGVNPEKFSRQKTFDISIRGQIGISDTTKVIGVVSVFRVQKRLFTWLDVAKLIYERNNNVHFIIVGDGPLNNELRAAVKERCMEQYVHFSGLKAEVRPYLQAMDLFMMTSEFEGLPIALLEAMSMNCIPACTSAGGIPEVVINKRNGILVPVEQPLQLVDEIVDLLNSPEMMNAYKIKARLDVQQKHSMQTMVNQLESLYKKELN